MFTQPTQHLAKGETSWKEQLETWASIAELVDSLKGQG